MSSRYPKNVNIYLMLKGNRGHIPTADIMVDTMDECFDLLEVEEEEREFLGDLLFRIQETAQIVQGLGGMIAFDVLDLPPRMLGPIKTYNEWTDMLNRRGLENH